MADTSEESKIDETETITTLTHVKDNMPLDKQTDWKRNTRKNGTRVFIGRRTGKTIKVNKSFNINDCFPQVEESDEENVSPKEIPKPAEKPAKAKPQANKAAKRHFIGRRTGKSISVKQPSNIQDFLNNIDNLFPQNSDDSIVKSINRNDKTINQTINQTIDQSINQSQVEEEKEETNQQEKENDNNVTATLDEKQPEHSPNLTGTAVKNTAELDESAVKFYGSKKRLFPSCEESIASQATDTSRVESNVQTEEDVDITAIDIDVENCSNATMSKTLFSAKSNTKKSHDMVKNTENEEKDIQKVSNTSVRNSKHKKQSIKSSIKKSKRSDFEEEDSEDEEIDVENCSSIVLNKSRNKSKCTEKADDDFEDIENEESTFVTLGKKTKSTSRISEIDVTGISFQIDESVVLEGTKHKEMSPEFGESSHQSKTKQASKETQRRRKTADKTHTENTLKDGSPEKRGDKTLIDSTNDQSSHDVSKSRRSTRRSAKQSSQTEQDSEENNTKGKTTRKSTRGKKADLTADHIDSHQAIPKKVSRKSILKRAPSNTSTLVSSETDAQSSDQNEESSAISRKSRKSIRFSKAIDTDKSETSVQDADDLNEDLEQSFNTSKKTRQSVRGKGKAKNMKTLDESHDDHTLEISNKALTSTRNNIEIPDQTSIDCSTISTRSTRTSRKGKDNNTALDSTKGRRSMKTRQSTLASETLDHERLSENVSKNLTTRSTDDHSSDQVDDDDDDASSSDHVDDVSSSDDDGSGSVIGDGDANDGDDSVDNDDDDHDDLNNDVGVATDDIVDDAGVEDQGDHDKSNRNDVDDGLIDDVDNDGINDDDELSQTKRQTRSIVNSTHHNDTTNSSETSSSKQKKTQRNNKSTLSKKDSKVSNTDGSTDDDKHNSKKQDENVGRKSMHTNSFSDKDKSDNKKDQTTRKSRGRPRKSTRSMVEASQCDDVPGSNDRTDYTEQSQADLTKNSQAEHTKDNPADNTKDSQTDDGQTSHIDTTNATQDSHDLQVSMSNDYEADESQSKTMSDSKRSASESEDDKKNKKKRRKKTNIIPKQLKNTNRKQRGRKLSKDNTSKMSIGGDSNASSDESSKSESVSMRGKRKTQSKGTVQDKSQSRQASTIKEDFQESIAMTDEDYQEMHDTIQNEIIPGNQGEDEKQHESKTTSDDENTHQKDSKKRRGQENNEAETTVNKKSRSRNRSHTNQTAMHSTSDDDCQSDSAVVTRKTRQQEKINNTRSRKRRNDSSESSTGSDNDSQSEQDKPGKTRKNNKKDKSETIINDQSKASGGSTVDSPATNTPMMTKSPFLHPKGSTLIKSILKSSLPRTVNSNYNRRVSISSKKHPIKSPENSASKHDRRRSSVSFAPTPSFRVAPDDSMTFEDSPMGYPSMSFLSNSSSYTLGESTFTPGGNLSLSSTISSIGSASKLSPNSTTFNESQEVTISSAKRQQVEEFQEDVIRRSKRTKVPPLEYWKNERINYKRRKSGWYIDGIEHVPTPKVPKRKARKTNKKKVSVAPKSAYDGYGGDEPQTFNGVPTDFDETPCEPVPVVNPYDGQEVKLELLHTPEMLQFVNTSQDPAGPDDPLVIDKYISHNSFGIGQLILRPGAEKGKQHVRKDTMAFHVLTGQVEVTIHETTALLRAGSTFYVPEGNCYNLKNTNDTDTRLFFVQIKSQD